MNKKIEIVDVDRSDYQNVCQLGEEIVTTIFKRMADLNIPETNFGNVIAVVCGSLAKLGADPDSFGEAIGKTMTMWSIDESMKAQLGLRFTMPDHEIALGSN